jgi:UPF0716 protein FxsA
MTMQAWFWMIIAVGFPALELVGIYLIWQEIGLWTLVWLLGATLWGIWLLRREHVEFLPRLAHSMIAGDMPFRVLFASARRVLAGLLLIFPGAISDLLAVALLLWPGGGRPPQGPAPHGPPDGVIEGEYRRVE